MKKPERDKPFYFSTYFRQILASLILIILIAAIIANIKDVYFMVGDSRLSVFNGLVVIGFAFLIIILFSLTVFNTVIVGKFVYRQLNKTSIQTLTTLSRIPLFLALGFAAYYSAEYNPLLILPVTAMFIGYAIVLTFARESGNVES